MVQQETLSGSHNSLCDSVIYYDQFSDAAALERGAAPTLVDE